MTTPDKKFDVVAIGAVCVDAQVIGDDALLERYSLTKAVSNDIGADVLKYAADDGMPKTAGGPATNIAAGIALRGGNAALVGKVAGDDLGSFFSARMQSFGVEYTALLAEDADKGTTFIMVVTTPDKERTFACYNGAGLMLSPEDIDRSLIREAKITYLDSYLWLSENGREAVRHAAETAKQEGSLVALSLNDRHIVEKNREAFLSLATSHADILVGDQKEFGALFGTTTLEETKDAVAKLGVIASITAGAKGAYVIEDGVMTHVPAEKIEHVVDTSGAGDAFAAGFLYGLSQGKTAPDAASIGASWAADIIQHFGAEPKIGKNASPSAPGRKHAP
ncbi:MAG: adenosine kinase [Alphaproteobacteria bacterium]|nr:MAG: adenosine kinase [Alphaproteobacteria bacterium]